MTNFGLASDKLVAADYDGDGKTDVAVFRPSNGTWYLLNSRNGQFNAAQFGQMGDVPAAADYDGDGKADFAVFRQSNGNWYKQLSSGGFSAVQFGLNGDVPIASAAILR